MNRADLNKIRRYSVADRKTKANVERFGVPPPAIKDFFDSLPEFLKAADIKKLAKDLISAKDKGRAVIWMMGAHSLKVGLSPVIIDLLNSGYISHLVLNGAGVIHDTEIAFWGRTSEEVVETLTDGSFGMVKETPQYLAQALTEAKVESGLGEAFGAYMTARKAKYKQYSVIAAAFKAKVPVIVHIAVGTDTVSQHPEFDGAVWGSKSQLDFKMLAASLKNIHNGGVVVNLGSAVILPEVFLKALTVARNLYGEITGFAAANFDMIQHYRPNENVVRRPTKGGGKRYVFTGHHEIMIPLLSAAIKSYEKQEDRNGKNS